MRVVPDPTLKVHATVKMARGNAPFHVVTYNPSVGGALDYLIAFQCGFILQLFENPVDQRFDFAPVQNEKKRLTAALSRSLPSGTPAEAVVQFASHLFNGLALQVRSIPVGLRIDEWLGAEFPELPFTSTCRPLPR